MKRVVLAIDSFKEVFLLWKLKAAAETESGSIGRTGSSDSCHG